MTSVWCYQGIKLFRGDKKKLLIIFLSILLTVKLLISQDILWQKTYGGNNFDEANALDIAEDGSIFVTGATYSFGAGLSDVYAIKLNKQGEIIWEKSYGGKDMDEGKSIKVLSDGSVVIVGGTNSFGAGESDVYVLKLDRDGNLEWQKTFGGKKDDWAKDLIVTREGEIIITGQTYSFGNGGSDIYVLKIDNYGNLIWEKTYGGKSYDEADAIEMLNNGNIIIAGYTQSFGAGGDVYILQIDKNGNLLWQKNFGSTGYEQATDLRSSEDNTILITGYTYSIKENTNKILVLKIDSSGNLLWQNTYECHGNDRSNTLLLFKDGGFAVAGYSEKKTDTDMCILRLDKNGNLIWKKSIGGFGSEQATDLKMTDDGNMIVTGWTTSFGIKNVYLVKLKSGINQYKRIRKHIQKYPPILTLSKSASLIEPSKDNVLDGREKGFIVFSIRNKGKGYAKNVKVKLTLLTPEKNLDYEHSLFIGDIAPDSEKIVKIPISANENISPGTKKFRIEVLEELGFDMTPFVFSFETKPFKTPKLIIAGFSIDDDKEGNSMGDNDGIIEPGEAIEINFAIQNKSNGYAKDVNVKVTLLHEGEYIYYTADKNKFDLGDIEPYNHKEFQISFMIAPRYKYEEIPIVVETHEAFGKYGFTDTIKLAYNRPVHYEKEIKITPIEMITEQPKKPKIFMPDVDNLPKFIGEIDENTYCVIIGIEEYKYAPPSYYSNRDAVIFYEYAKRVFGVPEENIYLRTNQDATKGEFDKIFEKNGWLERRVKPRKSKIIFYYSGHGAPGIKDKKPYLIPHDIDPKYAQTGVSLEDVIESLKRLDPEKAIIFLDACFTGVSRKSEMLIASARPLAVVKLHSKVPSDFLVFSASDKDEISTSMDENKHGLFTYYLLKAFHSSKITGDGKVFAGELYDYIKENVSKTARLMDIEQTPQLIGDKNAIVVKGKYKP